MKKKLTALLAATAICAAVLALTACGPATPSSVVADALDGMKAGDIVSMVSLFGDEEEADAAADEADATAEASDSAADAAVAAAASEGVFSGLFEEAEEGEISEEIVLSAQAASDLLIAKLTDFDYTIGQETIDGEKATVEVALNTYDIGKPYTKAMESFFQDLFTAAFAEAFGGPAADANAILGGFLDDITDGLNAQTEKSTQATVTFTLTQKDGEWTLDELSDNTLNALTGGLTGAVADMESWGE